MKILVAGPESSGTRMLTVLLGKCEGVETVHSSPAYKEVLANGLKYRPQDYDAAVLIIRNGTWNALSMVERGHFRSDMYNGPHEQIFCDIADVTKAFESSTIPLYVVTYEAMVYETKQCIRLLCRQLGIDTPEDHDPVQNGNEKFWSNAGWAGDNRSVAERIAHG